MPNEFTITLTDEEAGQLRELAAWQNPSPSARVSVFRGVSHGALLTPGETRGSEFQRMERHRLGVGARSGRAACSRSL